MALKIYQSGDNVALEKTSLPLLLIPLKFAALKVQNDLVIVYNTRSNVQFRDDLTANIQDSLGNPIGNIQDIVAYTSRFLYTGSSVTKPEYAGEPNTASNVGAGEGIFKQKVGVDLQLKSLVAGSSIALTAGTDDITIDVTGSASEPNIVNVLTAGDLPSTLAADTTYIINGSISTSTAITSVGNNAMIIGRKGRDSDILTYTGTGSFITFVDVNFILRNITLKATNPTSLLLDGTNYTGGAYNEGRDKVLSIFTCQFRNCYDVMTINGFDLVDINNSLFFYVQAVNHGCQFQSVSKLEFSSCELIRWFDETSLPTPSGYALAPMIDLIANGSQVGFGAVNVSGCIIHPQQTQDGIRINNSSTTGFGTIAANTFVDVGLTTGLTANLDYDIQNSYIIQANQKVENGNAKGTLLLSNNSVELSNSTAIGPPYGLVLNDANFVGGAGPTTPITFPVARRVITSSSNASFEYDSKVDGNFFVTLSASAGVNSNGTFEITIQFRQNGVPLGIIGKAIIRNSGGNYTAAPITLSLQGDATQGDVFDIYVTCDQANNVLISELVVNGFQL
jgi:hypothetical protein